MKFVVVSIRDVVADVFQTPFFQVNRGAAIRAFQDAVNQPDKNNMLYQHPDDYHLYYLGEYDDNTGEFALASRPEQLVIGRDMVSSKQINQELNNH